jgi:hypothetical protein
MLEQVKKKMKRLIREAFQADPNLVTAVARVHGKNFLFEEDAFSWIANWFQNENVGIGLPKDQVWFAD